MKIDRTLDSEQVLSSSSSSCITNNGFDGGFVALPGVNVSNPIGAVLKAAELTELGKYLGNDLSIAAVAAAGPLTHSISTVALAILDPAYSVYSAVPALMGSVSDFRMIAGCSGLGVTAGVAIACAVTTTLITYKFIEEVKMAALIDSYNNHLES